MIETDSSASTTSRPRYPSSPTKNAAKYRTGVSSLITRILSGASAA